MKKRTKIISSVTLIAMALLLIGIFFAHKHNKPIPTITPTLVELHPVEITDIPIVATATGNLVANQQTSVSPKVAGYVNKIFFNDGAFVQKGNVIVQLDSQKQADDLSAAKADAELSALQYHHDMQAYKKGLILQETIYNDKVTLEKNNAIVKSDQTALEDMSLTAPFSGYLGAKNFSLGDYVTPGQKLITLVDRLHLIVDYSLPSRYVPELKIGQAVTVTDDALPNKVFHATVNFISPYVDPNSQTVDVHALLDNKNGELSPGQFVNVLQMLGTHKDAILVPENTVFATLNGYHVFMVNKNKAVAVSVKTGEHIYNKIQITEGLQKGDLIVTVGQDQIKDGDPVKVVNGSR